MDPDLNKYDLNHAVTGHPTMSQGGVGGGLPDGLGDLLFRRARRAGLRRAAATKTAPAKALFVLNWFIGSIRIEHIHPLEAGSSGANSAATGGAGLPIEPALTFYPRILAETGVEAGALGVAVGPHVSPLPGDQARPGQPHLHGRGADAGRRRRERTAGDLSRRARRRPMSRRSSGWRRCAPARSSRTLVHSCDARLSFSGSDNETRGPRKRMGAGFSGLRFASAENDNVLKPPAYPAAEAERAAARYGRDGALPDRLHAGPRYRRRAARGTHRRDGGLSARRRGEPCFSRPHTAQSLDVPQSRPRLRLHLLRRLADAEHLQPGGGHRRGGARSARWSRSQGSKRCARGERDTDIARGPGVSPARCG